VTTPTFGLLRVASSLTKSMSHAICGVLTVVPEGTVRHMSTPAQVSGLSGVLFKNTPSQDPLRRTGVPCVNGSADGSGTEYPDASVGIVHATPQPVRRVTLVPLPGIFHPILN
jgi:hypothetical protein